jgi:enoyl-CoA hydratase/carnithine racemase
MELMAGVDAVERIRLGGGAARPRLTVDTLDRLRQRLRDAVACGVRLLVIEGGSESFCEGLDFAALLEYDVLGAPAAGNPHEDARSTAIAAATASLAVTEAQAAFATLLAELQRAPCPVIAVVAGAALGGGVGLAAAADIVIATDAATFALPETLFGLMPAAVFPVLAQRVGVGRARTLALTGRTLSAVEAAAWGLVDDMTAEPGAALRRLERRLLRHDTGACAALKRVVAEHFAAPPAYGADATAAFAELIAGDSARGRIRRFAAGEAPWPEEAGA